MYYRFLFESFLSTPFDTWGGNIICTLALFDICTSVESQKERDFCSLKGFPANSVVLSNRKGG